MSERVGLPSVWSRRLLTSPSRRRYEQVHTTGMDIKQSLSAAALLTIGKDMIFRDYAQGAFRMRGIGKGQTVHLFIVPEIKRLMARQLFHPHSTLRWWDGMAAVLRFC